MVSILQRHSDINGANNNNKKKMRGKWVSGKVMIGLCIASFLVGSLFTSQTFFFRPHPSSDFAHHHLISTNNMKNLDAAEHHEFDHKRKLVEKDPGDIMGEIIKTQQAIQSVDKSVSALEMELAAVRTSSSNMVNGAAEKGKSSKAFVVIGINTGFSSRKRRDSLRETWMLRGERLRKLEKEKGVVMRFVIGHNGDAAVDRAIDAEEAEHRDFLRLNHIEGYNRLSTKTRLFFSTAVSIWDAEFYVKVDDDVHLNLGTLVSTLAKHRTKPRIYIGCMKSGPVLSHKGVKYHEPEYWKFGEEGNKYFRHATGQIYAISKDLATYISINSGMLHRFANEDVSMGAWLIGLEVQHVDDHSMCCGTTPDCEFKSAAGNHCVASFDWECSGVCKSVERMKKVHSVCGEGDGAIWNVHLI
ncbi:putative beta-1,3-galactosyltransferase 8 [Castilleja foliolosa]|uniref:Hexosyltransferase n=1 Tax=Castilleja foliolosa TaxID=1961234 RepID=A0ABD3DKA5_9LAMI